VKTLGELFPPAVLFESKAALATAKEFRSEHRPRHTRTKSTPEVVVRRKRSRSTTS
jgi:hypothetical protein